MKGFNKNIVDITEKGCIGDGLTLNTTLQSIIDECSKNGEIIFIPKGEFLTEGLIIRNNTHIIGTLDSTIVLNKNSINKHCLLIGKGVNAIISNINIKGSNTEEYCPNRGEYIGIYVEQCERVLLDNILVEGFDKSGLYCTEIGYNNISEYYKNLHVRDCRFEKNSYGITLYRRAEYVQFTNVTSAKNNIGCVNAGGNNMFSNCSFNRNKSGMYVVGGSDYPNNSHGSAVSCQFNHNLDESLVCNNVDVGYMFVGCQFYDGDIKINNSKGIILNACEGGTWSISGNGEANKNMITSSFFYTKPTIINDGTLIFNNNI